MFCQSIFVASPKSCSVYIGPRTKMHLSGSHVISRTNSMYIYPYERNLDALPKLGVIMKSVGASNALLCGCKNSADY